jgi:hypothetical protein
MVDIRVSVMDAAGASALIRRLATLFDRGSIRYDWSRDEVRVESEWESRAVVRVLELVAAWLEEDGVDSTTLSIGDRSHTLVASRSLGVVTG